MRYLLTMSFITLFFTVSMAAENIIYQCVENKLASDGSRQELFIYEDTTKNINYITILISGGGFGSKPFKKEIKYAANCTFSESIANVIECFEVKGDGFRGYNMLKTGPRIQDQFPAINVSNYKKSEDFGPYSVEEEVYFDEESCSNK